LCRDFLLLLNDRVQVPRDGREERSRYHRAEAYDLLLRYCLICCFVFARCASFLFFKTESRRANSSRCWNKVGVQHSFSLFALTIVQNSRSSRVRYCLPLDSNLLIFLGRDLCVLEDRPQDHDPSHGQGICYASYLLTATNSSSQRHPVQYASALAR
jgi:hypothetical protein